MRSRVALGGLTLAVLTGLALPAQAAPTPSAPPAPQPPAASPSFEHTLAGAGARVTHLPQGLQRDRVVSALVELGGDPVSVQRSRARGRFDAATAEERVARVQAGAVPALEAAGATVYGRLDTVLNAVQVRVRVSDLDAVAAVRGVRTVQVSRVVTLDNARSEQVTGVDQAWQDLGLTGRGQVVGVIDTGIDYTHADFGGRGTAAAFRANDGAVVEPRSFPTAKVTGGHDFVGDSYDASSQDPALGVPHPDRDPLDCQGHGSHVAGTVAGAGVTSTGATYRGRYTEATLKNSFRVQPGVAPQATLKAYRVFGCNGAANDDVIIAAIDRAVADGVDVINMSLGSAYGTADDLETRAVTAATAAGVLVVAAAGNSGGGAYLTGSPATADGALAVAAVDAETRTTSRVASFSAAGPRRLDSALKPDLAAPGVEIPSVDMGSGTRSVRMSGTSMATPHTAGVAALVRQAHPTWSPRQVKAALMSTASATAVAGYDTRRAGVGLVQARRATATKTYAWTPTGLNSLSFGMDQLAGARTESRSFSLSNRSKATVVYTLSAAFNGSARGVAATVSPRTLTLKPGRTGTVTLALRFSRADVAALPGASASDGGALSTVRGLVSAKPKKTAAGVTTLRMAFLAVPVPLSSVAAPATVTTRADGSATLRLQNSGPRAATTTLFQRLLSDPAGDAPTANTPDVVDLGVMTAASPDGDPGDRQLVFAVNQARGSSTQGLHELDVTIDTNGDGVADFHTFAADTGTIDDGEPDGTLTAFTVTPDGALVDRWTASAAANGSTVLLPVLASSLGLRASSPAATIRLSGFATVDAGVDTVAGSARFQPFAPALSQGQRVTLQPGASADLAATVTWSRVAAQTNRGWLVVTPDDAAGAAEADTVTVTPAG